MQICFEKTWKEAKNSAQQKTQNNPNQKYNRTKKFLLACDIVIRSM